MARPARRRYRPRLPRHQRRDADRVREGARARRFEESLPVRVRADGRRPPKGGLRSPERRPARSGRTLRRLDRRQHGAASFRWRDAVDPAGSDGRQAAGPRRRDRRLHDHGLRFQSRGRPVVSRPRRSLRGRGIARPPHGRRWRSGPRAPDAPGVFRKARPGFLPLGQAARRAPRRA